MSFQSALSGLNAAAGNLNVTGHNIANSSTTGFKQSRAEFADVYAINFGGVAKTATGSGVRMSNVAQQFTQGNIDFTENNLDLAISGDGFFCLSDDGERLYTRAGNFSIDRDGYVVNSHDQRLQSYAVNSSGQVTNFSPQDLQLNLGANPARATDTIDLNVNLDASSEVSTVMPIATDDPATYNFSTTTTVYDSLGVTHDATLYFQKSPATSKLDLSGQLQTGGAAYVYPGNPVTVYDSLGNAHSIGLDFTNSGGDTWNVTVSGLPVGPVTQNIDLNGPTLDFTIAAIDWDAAGSGALPADMVIDLNGITPTTSASSVTLADQTNGGPAGAWNVLMTIDSQIFDTETILFDNSGSLAVSPPSINFTNALVDSPTTSGTAGTLNGFNPTNAAPMQITVDFTGSTQFGASSSVNTLVQNGYTTGTLSGVSIDTNGVVFARYTNGQSESLGAVALVKFPNPQGLQQVGDTNWAGSFASGDPIAGQAGAGTFGQIQSGALEASNVDISKQLVNMIIAQRDYQANAKMISTEDQITQTIINIR